MHLFRLSLDCLLVRRGQDFHLAQLLCNRTIVVGFGDTGVVGPTLAHEVIIVSRGSLGVFVNALARLSIVLAIDILSDGPHSVR